MWDVIALGIILLLSAAAAGEGITTLSMWCRLLRTDRASRQLGTRPPPWR
jgi:hypothetical protein